ncbi:MAG TPA: methenyltetrahydromethanopterin cyclohydrolase [Halobacteriales archaeon]|nr:methenyltetrahydromethanopterin cyclohydrolase [Halobacteriales archaeon]
MENPNRMALDLVDEAIDFADELAVGVHHLENDAAVLDFGVERRGGLEAGVLLTEAATGGLATVHVELDTVAGAALPHVEVATDHPRPALLACQSPDWPLEVDGEALRGAGPAQHFRDAGPNAGDFDDADFAVLVLEADRLPDEALAETVANVAGVPTSGVFVLVAPASSVAGGVAFAARAAERTISRLAGGGYDAGRIRTVAAGAPVAPIADDEDEARVRSAGAIAYGGRVHIVVEEDVARPGRLAYGGDGRGIPEPAVIEEGGHPDRLDDVLAPAQVTVDVVGGPTHVVGGVDEGLLGERLGL